MGATLRKRSLFSGMWVTCAWGICVLAGLFILIRYQNNPASVKERATQWPVESNLLRNDSPTLVMTLHPHCPCSRASLIELEKLLLKSSEPVQSIVLVYAPVNAGENWSGGLSLQMAEDLAKVQLIIDSNGEISKTFGLRTSGETALYSVDGQLLFAGGITASRGHIGANVGSATVYELLANQKTELRSTPVFGCAITTATEDGM